MIKEKFIRIKDKIKSMFSIFSKNKQIKLLEQAQPEQIENNSAEKEKKRIFDLYNQIKNKSIEIETLPQEDLLKIHFLFKEELNYYIRKNKEQEEINRKYIEEIEQMDKVIQNLA